MKTAAGTKRPTRGGFASPFRPDGSSRGVIRRVPRRSILGVMSATATLRRFLAIRSGPRAILDAAVAAAALAGTLAQLRHGGMVPTRGGGQLDPTGVLLAVAAAGPVIAWRRSPYTVFVATGAAGVTLAALGYPVDLMLGPTAALYLLAASRTRNAPWTWRTSATVAGLFVAYLAATAAAQRAVPGLELLHTGLAWGLAWFAGERNRLRREQLADLRQRAIRAERDAERDRQLAVAEERARIARDLHDSAGHAISVIAVRAGAARLRHRQQPDRSLQALAAIEDQARQTVAELDQLVGTLREHSPVHRAVEAPPGLASLDTLLAHHTTTGLRVSLHTTGTPLPLAGAADHAAYRILQEGLRNAARHGTGTAQVNLAFGDTALELTISNPVPAGAAPRAGGGHGLIGMRERAVLLSGTLHTGREDGTFAVRARIPYQGHKS